MCVGHVVLAHQRKLVDASIGVDEGHTIGIDLEARARLAGVVHHDEVELLRAPASSARGQARRRFPARSRRPPCPGGRAARVSRRISGAASRASSGTRSRFLILPGATAAGRKSAGAAAMISTSDVAISRGDARRASRPTVSTWSTRAPTGGGSASGPATSTTSAPRRHAAAATATPMRPLLRLEMNRTGSMASRVGPADTRTRLPVRTPAGFEQARGVSDDRFGLGHATGPGAFTHGEFADVRVEHQVPEVAQVRDVAPGLSVRPHAVVHRRHEEHRGRRGEQAGGEQVVRATGRGARQEIGGARRDEHQVAARASGCGRARGLDRAIRCAPGGR